MIKKYVSVAAAFTIAVLFFSCDEVDPPYTENTGNNQIQDSSCVFEIGNPNVYRKILLEDYTGHLCGTCPPASAVLYNNTNGLKQRFGDTLITVGVHASNGSTFTETCPPHSYPNGAAAYAPVYAEDFRTPAGEDWLAFFGILSNPQGMVSRKDYPGTHVKSYTVWGSEVQLITNLPAQVRIQVINTYDSISGNLKVCIKTTFLSALSGTYYLSVVLTEDSIKAWQVDYALPPSFPNDTNYIHRHVMRGALNSTWGVQLNSSAVAAGDTVRNAYSVNLSNLPASVNPVSPLIPLINPAHCSIVAFIYDDATKEILQAEEAEVQ